MKEHPEELLAEFVEGSLAERDRAVVEEHLATCERCREEVGLARRARTAVAALPELSPPPELDTAIRRAVRDEPGPSRARRLVAGLAAAAVLIGGGAFVVTSLQGGSEETATREAGPPREAPHQEDGEGGLAEDDGFAGEEAAPADARATAPVVPTYAESQREYSPSDLPGIASRLRDDARQALDLGLADTASGFFRSFDIRAFTPEVRQAIRCVLTEVPPEQLIVPFQIEAASFEGQSAYVAAFLQGPTPDEPYDRIVIWVVSRDACTLLSLASQQL